MTSRMDEEIVRFKTEAKAIIDQLTNATEKIEIASILGMTEQGTTTLAKKVYSDLSVKYHFHKLSCCYVTILSMERFVVRNSE